MNLNFIANNIQDLVEISQQIISQNSSKRKYAFYGEMGAGKTTLIKAFTFCLGVKDIVTSPTFSIINEYFSHEFGSVFHFDFYRIDSELEAYDIGYEEYFYNDNYCFIEWPDNIKNLVDDNMVKIYIKAVDESKRIIKVNFNL